MGKRLISIYEADTRAIEFHLQLREIEKLPLVEVEYPPDHKSIILAEKGNFRMYIKASINFVLSLDVEKARANGGTYKALLATSRPPKARIPQKEVEEGTYRFLRGDND